VLLHQASFLNSSLSIQLDEEARICAVPVAFDGCPQPNERDVGTFMLFLAGKVPGQQEKRADLLLKLHSEQQCLRAICQRLAEVLAASLVAQEAPIWFGVCQNVTSLEGICQR
jgi:hypothetical protein